MPEGQAVSGYTDDQYVPYIVADVLNFGGFFGGETVTLDASPRSDLNKLVSFIIPEHVFDNLTVRHLISSGMALGLVVDNGEVRAARILGAPTREQLKEIVKPPAHTEEGGPAPRALSYKCKECNLWISGTPNLRDGSYYCTICGEKLG
jgi:hypothetical protein